MSGKMKRCTRCILPESYPGITYDAKGVCDLCTGHKERKYLGEEALKKDIESFYRKRGERNDNYDCLLGVSGGRDSSYLLYVLTKVLNLKVLAYSADHGFVPDQAKLNMKNAVEKTNTELIVESYDIIKKCLGHTTSAWARKPSLEMIETFCTGCRLEVIRGMINLAKKKNIPVIIRGGTPFELAIDYKTRLISLNKKGNTSSMMLGYLSQIIRNPKWIMNRNYMMNQFKEYYYLFHQPKLIKKAGILKLRPFFDYFRWEEKRVIKTIKDELRWDKNPNSESTWRGDCDIASLKLYLYKQYLGFNDKAVGLSHLIRDKQISRKEALERVKKEERVSLNTLRDFFEKNDLDYSEFQKGLGRICRRG